jgi:hypothetical protein
MLRNARLLASRHPPHLVFHPLFLPFNIQISILHSLYRNSKHLSALNRPSNHLVPLYSYAENFIIQEPLQFICDSPFTMIAMNNSGENISRLNRGTYTKLTNYICNSSKTHSSQCRPHFIPCHPMSPYL